MKLEDVKVHVLLFAFDCLFLNGDVLVEKTLTERRKALEAAIEPRQGVLQIATSKVHLWPAYACIYAKRETSHKAAMHQDYWAAGYMSHVFAACQLTCTEPPTSHFLTCFNLPALCRRSWLVCPKPSSWFRA